MNICEFKIIGMQDEQCLRAVMNAIQDLPGIGWLEISLESGAASVEHGNFVAEADIRQAVEETGFDTI